MSGSVPLPSAVSLPPPLGPVPGFPPVVAAASSCGAASPAASNSAPRGRQFFQNPGPTNIPDRVLRSMDRPVLDFLSEEFLAIQRECHAGVKRGVVSPTANSSLFDVPLFPKGIVGAPRVGTTRHTFVSHRVVFWCG